MIRTLLLIVLALGACSTSQPSHESAGSGEAGLELSEMFDLQHTAASEMAAALTERLVREGYEGVEVLPNPRTNKLIVAGSRSEVAMVGEWIADLDIAMNARRSGG